MSAPTVTLTRRIPVLKGVGNGMLGLGLVLAAVVCGLMVFRGVLASADPYGTALKHRLLSPGEDGHLLGTDQLGRDVWARVLAGFPRSLGVALLATSIGGLIGAAVGVYAGWTNGRVQLVIARFIDVGISFPYLVIAVTIIAVVGRGLLPLALTLGLVSWPTVARVIYAETLGLRTREYVMAARLAGVAPTRILLTHIVPGLRPTFLVLCAFQFADMLVAESSLSFLGLGAPLATPTWGNMLSDSRNYLSTAPWMMLAPAGAIVLAVITANTIGDGLAARSRARARAVDQ